MKKKLIKFNKADVKKDVLSIMKKSGEETVSRDYYVSKGKYNYEKVKAMFGTWKNVLVFCGVKKKSSSQTLTRKQFKDDILSIMEEHDKATVTRAFYEKNGTYKYTEATSLFGTWIEAMTYCGVRDSRAVAKYHRDIAKHNSLDEVREFYHAQVLPNADNFIRKTKKTGYETAIIGSDFHDIDTCPFAIDVMVDTVERYDPKFLILNGDVFDEYEFSRFDKDPRLCDVAKRFDFVKEKIFRRLREAAPDAQIDLIIGNHEYRVLKMLSGSQPYLKDLLGNVMGLSLADMFGLSEFGINLVCKLDLATWSKVEENAELRKNYKVYNGFYTACHDKDWNFGTPGTNGHTHRPSIRTKANIPHGIYSWMNTPAMCTTDADYIHGPITASTGFGMAHFDLTRQKVNQTFFITSDGFVEIGGKFYYQD
jgi:hypothetical protein